MKIMVSDLVGDATVLIYNKQGELILVEPFCCSGGDRYVREISVDPFEYGYSKALFSGKFEYKVVV